MSGRLFVGIDLGTQSVKVCIADRSGVIVAPSSRPLSSMRVGVRHEQDPADWIQVSRAALADAIGKLDPPARKRISAVSMCGTSGTITVVDKAGVPQIPGIMYDDARAADLVAEVTAADPCRWERLGYRIQPSWALPKVTQLARESLPLGSHIAHQTDVVAGDITGGPVATDWSSALKSGYDLLELCWPVDAFELLGISALHLPEVVAPGSVIGHSSTGWESSTGLPAGTPIVAGMTDGCASQLGAGALKLGDWHSVIGTTLVLKGVSAAPVHDTSGAVYSHKAPHDDMWLPGGASSVGARAITALLDGADLDHLGQAAAQAWTDRTDTSSVVYPLIGTGERFPFVQPDATGFVVTDGVELPLESLGDGVRALLGIFVGVACVERLCFDTLAARGAPLTGRLSTSGGGTRSPLWTQLRADALNHSIAIPESAEPALGMAILAASAVEEDSIVGLAESMTSIERVVEPDPHGVTAMAERYAAFADRLNAKGWLTV